MICRESPEIQCSGLLLRSRNDGGGGDDDDNNDNDDDYDGVYHHFDLKSINYNDDDNDNNNSDNAFGACYVRNIYFEN
jgi:hypothetical protein